MKYNDLTVLQINRLLSTRYFISSYYPFILNKHNSMPEEEKPITLYARIRWECGPRYDMDDPEIHEVIQKHVLVGDGQPNPPSLYCDRHGRVMELKQMTPE